MRKYLRSLIIGASIAGLAFPLSAQAAPDAGTDSALYLGSGARAIAMGRTGVTAFDSAFTADWNPGSLGFSPQCSVSLQHASLFGNAWHESLGFVFPTLDYGTLSLTFARMEVGGIERRDEYNLPRGDFGMTEQQAVIGYGYNVWGPFSAGTALRVHNLRLDGLTGTSPGIDAGIAFKLPLRTIILKEVSSGFSCRNALGPALKLSNEADRLFPTWRLGAAVKMELVPDFPDRLIIRAEAEKPERADIRRQVGLEYTVYDLVSVRGGWDHEYLSAGIGVTYLGLTFDYALSFPDLGMRHLMTLSYAIGQSVIERRANRERDAERRRQKIVENMKNKIIRDYIAQAKIHTQKQEFEEAAKLWEKVLDWAPDNAEAKTKLAHMEEEIVRVKNSRDLKTAQDYLRKKQYIDVMVECQRVLERDPKNAIAKSLHAQAEKKAQNLGKFSYTTNVKLLQRIREEYQLGLQAYTKRDYLEAVKHWERVIEASPLQKQVYRYLQSARTRILKAQKTKNKTPKIARENKKKRMYKKAVEFSREGKLKDAVRSWEKLVKENPNDRDAKQNLDKTRKNLIDSQKKGIRW
ncbi:PorV/PorQ family protein [bacterium]|nr:PorV/PorQ family protein [bacterium]